MARAATNRPRPPGAVRGRSGRTGSDAEAPANGAQRQGPLLDALGRTVRAWREARGLTQRELARRADVSPRFLTQLEAGTGNISVARLAELAAALEVPLSALTLPVEADGQHDDERRPLLLGEIARALAAAPVERLDEALAALRPAASAAPAGPAPTLIALVGLRGAGKSTLGPALAEALGLPFHEVDDLIAEQSGLALPEIFEMHGEEYYREAERRALERLIASGRPAVVAVSGGVVTDPPAFALLRQQALLVWLKATPELHMRRVEAQGDYRPMRNRPNAMAELKGLLRKRWGLYRQAHILIDTAGATPAQSRDALLAAVERAGFAPPGPNVAPAGSQPTRPRD